MTSTGGAPPAPGAAPGPLAGLVVLDASRMLPGAVLARVLLDLGARVVKVEAPGGDPMRAVPPRVDGVGAGFRALLAGAESVALDLADPAGAEALRRLALGADVLVESFRPGTMETWGLGWAALAALNPRLVYGSLPAFAGGCAGRVGHDLDLAARSGLLELLGGAGRAAARSWWTCAGRCWPPRRCWRRCWSASAPAAGARVEQPLAAAPAALPRLGTGRRGGGGRGGARGAAGRRSAGLPALPLR